MFDALAVISVEAWAALAASVFAGLAAAASWRSSQVAARAYTASQRPLLKAQLLFVADDSGRICLRIENVGGGTAQVVTFYLGIRDGVGGGGYLSPTGFLRAGQGVTIVTEATAPSDADQKRVKVIVSCVDAADGIHSWNREGRHKYWPSRFWRTTKNAAELYDCFYPKIDHKLLTPIRFSQGSPD